MIPNPLSKPITLTANVEPMGCVRMTQRGKWTSPAAQRYIAYKGTLSWLLQKRWASEPTECICGIKITFYMPIPKSWSQKKRKEHEGQLHNKKPDIDNIIKGLFDAANGIIWKDDNQVARVEAEKRYSSQPRIEMEVTLLY